MQTMQHRKTGLTDTSYAETSFGMEERLKALRDKEIERRLNALRNPNTGLLNMTKIEFQNVTLSEEDKQKEIKSQRFDRKTLPQRQS